MTRFVFVDEFSERLEIRAFVGVLLSLEEKKPIEQFQGPQVRSIVFDRTERDRFYQFCEPPFLPRTFNGHGFLLSADE